MSDITGRRFGRLTVQNKVENVSEKGYSVWHCRCDCGCELDVPYNTLMYGNQISCGCKKREHNKSLGSFQARVDGTSLDLIKSDKLPTDNTTGYKGVYYIKGKYVAKIVFRKKAYYLGAFDDIEDAHRARLEAEEALYRPTVEYHERWSKRASTDPEWAKANPMQIFVERLNDRLSVSFLPVW